MKRSSFTNRIRLLLTMAVLLIFVLPASKTLAQQNSGFQVMGVRQTINGAAKPARLEGVRVIFSYINQPGTPPRFLNIYAQLPGQNSYAWVAMNIFLNNFQNTRLLSRGILLNQLGIQNNARIPLLNISVLLSNTAITNAVTPPPFTTYQCPLDSTFMFDGRSSDVVATIGPNPAPINFGGPVQASIPRGCKVPNIDLDNSNHPAVPGGYGGDAFACGPAAVANSLSWIQAEDSRVGTDGLTTVRQRLEELSDLMKRKLNETVTPEEIVQAKVSFIAKYGLKLKVEYRGFSGDYDDDVKWLKDQYDAGQDIEMDYSYEQDGKVLKHVVVLSDLQIVGTVPQITIKDDDDQLKPGGTAEEKNLEFKKSKDGHITFVRNKVVCTVNNMYAESYDPDAGTYTDPKTNTQTTKFCQGAKNKCEGACPALIQYFDANQMPVVIYPVCDKKSCCDIDVFYTTTPKCTAEGKKKCKGKCGPIYRTKEDAQKKRRGILGECDKACICQYDLRKNSEKRIIPLEEVIEGKLKIYPNPTAQQINIVVRGYEGVYRLQLINVLGQELIARSIELDGQETYTLDVSALVNGIYYVILSNEEKMSGVFVKE